MAGDTSVRHPHRVTPSVGPRAVTESELIADAQTLRQIIEGLEQLQESAAHTDLVRTAEQRGYLTPGEDDRVRQGLLAYRNYRLALYEIILRLEHYPRLKPVGLRVKAFLVAFAAALTLYAKSLQLDELATKSDLVRAKLNEPEPKFDLEGGFFDEVMSGFCSLRNYGLILRAFWFWSTRRRAIRAQARLEPGPWAWLERLALAERRTVQAALNRVFRRRLEQGWREFWKTAFKPVEHAQYGVRSRVGGRFAGFWLHPEAHQALDDAALHQVHPLLRPGDVVLMRSEGKLTAALLPGFWAHAAIHLGSREDLAALDSTQANAPEEDQFCGFVIEALSPCVRIASLRRCLDADHVLVLRPQLPPEVTCDALKEALRHLGKAYDFEFDFNLSNRIVCTGLVYRSYHGRGDIEFSLVKRLGNYTLTGDDLASQSLVTGFEPVALVLRREKGWQLTRDPRRIRTLQRRIEKGWRPVQP